MSIITRMRKQTAVYWPLAGDESGQLDYDAFGRPQWGTPVQISCRWEDVSQEIIQPDGTNTMTKSVVYVDVDQDVRVGGVLYLGLLADVDQDDPKGNDGAWEIIRFDKLPDLKAREYLGKAYL